MTPGIHTLAGTRRALTALLIRLSLVRTNLTCPKPKAYTAKAWVSGRVAVLFSPMHNSMDKFTALSSRRLLEVIITMSKKWDEFGTTTQRICFESA